MLINVLVVDDEEYLLEIARQFLEMERDLKVDTALCGEDALELLEQDAYDAVVADYRMPGMDGLELLNCLRSRGFTNPFILFTGRGREEVAVQALRSGASFYLQKGGDLKAQFAELVNMIKMAVAERKAGQELKAKERSFHEFVTAFEAMATDAAKGKRAEESLRELSARLCGVLEISPAALVVLDHEGKVVVWSMAAEHMFGWSQAEVVGQPCPLVPAERLEEEGELRRQVVQGAVLREVEVSRQRKDGAPIELRLSACAVADPTGQAGVAFAFADTTDRKAYEAALHQANRKVSVLGGTTRREIMDQLELMHGYLDIATNSAHDEQLKRYLLKASEIEESVRRLMQFSSDFERIGRMRPEWFRLKDAAVRGLSSLDLDGIAVEMEVDGLEVFADRSIEKVFRHLVENAIDHGQTTTQVWIGARETNEGLVVTVEDDGVGIPPERKEQIFEGGEGRGLLLAREILACTKAVITETGQPWTGSRFEICFPKGSYRRAQ